MPARFWNEEVETLSAAAEARLESKSLQTQMPYVFAASPFYRSKFEQAVCAPRTSGAGRNWPRCR